MKIALAQLNSNDDINHNLDVINALVEKATVEKPEIIFFPENSLFFRLDSAAPVQSISLESQIFQKLCDLSKKTKISLHLTTALKDEFSEKVYNSSVLIKPNHSPVVLYRKIHLFDIDLKDQKAIRESDHFSYGQSENIFELNGFKFGSSICYDIRFSELYSRYAQQNVDVILVPAAFLVKTGQAHWEVLLRARAIESQCYVLAAAQSGRHVGADPKYFRETYGHSMVVDPWGKIISCLDSGLGLVYSELNKTEIQSVREQIPMNQHRRL